MKKQFTTFLSIAVLTALPAFGASLALGTAASATSSNLVSENNQNFNISVFDGAASFDNSGTLSTNPPLATTTMGDGTALSYNFVGNSGTGSALTTYASGGTRTPTPTATAASVHGGGEDWANVWTTTDPAGFTSPKNHNPTGVAGAANTFARAANVSGTIDISGLEYGRVYIPHGTYNNGWTLTLTMTGAGQTDIVAADSISNGVLGNQNRGWVSDFDFDNAGDLYDTISYTYVNNDADGSRARFMGVTLVPEPSSIALLGLAGLGLLRRRR